MIDRNQRVRQLLNEIEQEMRLLDLWSIEPPEAEALASTEPFCVDTLSLSEWMQWILIPRMRELLNGNLPLPGNCNVHAIAEESFKELTRDCSTLLSLIRQFDESLTLPH